MQRQPIDFSSPPEVYWKRALERIDEQRRELDMNDHSLWEELERLQKLEAMARFCLEDAS